MGTNFRRSDVWDRLGGQALLMIDLCCLEYHQYKGNVSGIVKVWKKKKNEKRKKPADDYKHGYILKT